MHLREEEIGQRAWENVNRRQPRHWKEQETSFGGRVTLDQDLDSDHWRTGTRVPLSTVEACPEQQVVILRRLRGRTWDSYPWYFWPRSDGEQW